MQAELLRLVFFLLENNFYLINWTSVDFAIQIRINK